MCQLQTENQWINVVLVRSNCLCVSCFIVYRALFLPLFMRWSRVHPFLNNSLSWFDHALFTSLLLCWEFVHLFLLTCLYHQILLVFMFYVFSCFALVVFLAAFSIRKCGKVLQNTSLLEWKNHVKSIENETELKNHQKKMNNKRNGKECKKCQMHVSKNSNKNMSFLAHLRLLQKKQKNIRSRGPRQNYSAETSTYQLFVVES